MTKEEKELDEMKTFVTSAGCMTIEHISSTIRKARLAVSKEEIRNAMDKVKHFADVFHEDFGMNFPKGKKDGQLEHSDEK